jgi:hypothetical protein
LEDIGPIPDAPTPLKPIISWYNIARKRIKAPNYQVEAHVLGISLPKITNISHVNQFEDSELEILDKYSINLPVAALISHVRTQMEYADWKNILSDEYLSKLTKSDRPIHDLWLTVKGEKIFWSDVFDVFLDEGYCGHMYQYRIQKSKKSSSFENLLQRTLKSIARGNTATKSQINLIMQAYNQEKDSGDYDWFAPRFHKNCPHSVKILAEWNGN